MTIAAGFKVEDGILICADTQYVETGKTFGTKIFPVTLTGDSYVFALAGNEQNALMAIQECQDEIEALAPERRTVRSVTTCLRNAVKTICDAYVLARPEFERRDLEFQLVIACWIPHSGGTHLFSVGTKGAIIERDYEILGGGSYLGHYILGNLFSTSMNMEGVIIIAAQILRSVKSYDPNCGGKSMFVTLDNKGQFLVIPHELHNLEVFLSAYESLTRTILFRAGNPMCAESEIDTQVQHFADQIKALRRPYITENSNYRAMFLSLPKQSQ